MPRNVRNWWIEGKIDGRSAEFSGGPQSKDGGFTLKILQRDKGNIVTALHINGRVLSDGTLILHAETGSTLKINESLRELTVTTER